MVLSGLAMSWGRTILVDVALANFENIVNLVENMMDAFFATDRQGFFTYINSETMAILQLEGQEILNQSMWETVPKLIGTTFKESEFTPVLWWQV